MANWYDYFIPPEIQAGRKAYAGDWEGALEAELGLGGTFVRKAHEGQEEQRQGYTDAVKNLGKLAEEQRKFQMEGLDRAENYYAPMQERLTALYGAPGTFRK
jgi:hypothetical protein